MSHKMSFKKISDDASDGFQPVKQVELVMENLAERRSRLRSIYIIHFAMFIFSLGFSIILTGVYPYLKQVCFVLTMELLDSHPANPIIDNSL